VTDVIRSTDGADRSAIAAIYGDAVTASTASVEREPPTLSEMRRGYEVLRGGGYPRVVAD
jgi:L-amino acid N-acyltransferase YncA